MSSLLPLIPEHFH
jgi:hypothetical protein